MTEKQQRILEVALELFAKQGYANTPTSKIARDAGVSEGLIFRHFNSKEGLLEALINHGFGEINAELNRLEKEEDPKEVLRKTLDFCNYLLHNDNEFWNLLLTIKYQSPEIARKYHDTIGVDHLKRILEKVFRELGYRDPEAEAKMLFMVLTSMFSYFLEESNESKDAFFRYLRQKYSV